MNRTCAIIILSFIVSSLTGCAKQPAGPAVYYVSPSGNDSWSGKLSEPDASGTDGPFATLEKARDTIRALKQATAFPLEGVTVLLRGGVYPIWATCELTPGDSGTETAPVIWKAFPGETAVLTGGKVLTGFVPVTDTDILKRLDPVAQGNVIRTDLAAQDVTGYGSLDPRSGKRMELFFKNRFMKLARYPNDEWLTIADVPQTGEKMINMGLDRDTSAIPRGRHYGRFTYSGDRPNRWAVTNDIWVHGYWTWDWSDQYLAVEKIDKKKRDIYPREPHHGYGYTTGQRFYFLNILEELDSPGEWYVDRANGILYFWPPEPVRDGDVTISVMENVLISLKETANVTISGIIFECSQGSAVSVEGGTRNRIAGCTFRNFGLGVVSVNGGTDNGVLSCDIYDVGAGGISISGGDRKTLTPGGNFADNNHIHHFGERIKTYSPALSVHGVGNRLAHNSMHDSPHMAVSFHGNENILEFNEVHHIAKETGDVGAFYIGRDWTVRGNIIRHNYFHDLLGPGLYGVMAVYLDDAASGMTIYGNVFYKAGRAAFIGGGHDNIIENNIFVDCAPSVHIDARGLGWAQPYIVRGGSWNMYEKLEAVNYKEPPYSTKYPGLPGILDHGDPAMPRGNVVARNVSMGGQWLDLDKKIEEGLVTFENNLVDEDPGFIDPANGNFQLRDDSPAYKLGFKRIPVEQIGLYVDEYRTSLPEKTQ